MIQLLALFKVNANNLYLVNLIQSISKKDYLCCNFHQKIRASNLNAFFSQLLSKFNFQKKKTFPLLFLFYQYFFFLFLGFVSVLAQSSNDIECEKTVGIFLQINGNTLKWTFILNHMVHYPLEKFKNKMQDLFPLLPFRNKM